jgi:hypothetical protein|tara:strand:- start:171 stop:404 length:234 start_codon:yes stop_codon:yes gene_type:complete
MIQTNLQTTATTAKRKEKRKKEVFRILGNKATLYTNKFNVYQFRLWLKNENKYVRKSLHTKVKSYAIEQGEELYFAI